MNQAPQPLTYLAGVVATELEIKGTSVGQLVTFRLAVTTSYGEQGSNGETTFWDVVVKNPGLQQTSLRDLYKGSKIAVQGRAKLSEYNGKIDHSIWADRIGLVDWLRREQASAPAAVTTSNTETGDELGF